MNSNNSNKTIITTDNNQTTKNLIGYLIKLTLHHIIKEISTYNICTCTNVICKLDTYIKNNNDNNILLQACLQSRHTIDKVVTFD
jgi:hypothetical protein